MRSMGASDHLMLAALVGYRSALPWSVLIASRSLPGETLLSTTIKMRQAAISALVGYGYRYITFAHSIECLLINL